LKHNPLGLKLHFQQRNQETRNENEINAEELSAPEDEYAPKKS